MFLTSVADFRVFIFYIDLLESLDRSMTWWGTPSCFQVPAPSDDDILHSNSLEDLLSTAAATETTELPEPAFNHSETPVELQEHQYCLPALDPDFSDIPTVMEDKRRKTTIEPSFTAYNQISR